MARVRSSSGTVSSILIILFLILAALLSCRGFLVPEDRAVSALDKRGYSNIEIIDRDVFFTSFKGCGEKDAVKFDARATNPAGEDVEVFVCSGWLFKGETVRTD